MGINTIDLFDINDMKYLLKSGFPTVHLYLRVKHGHYSPLFTLIQPSTYSTSNLFLPMPLFLPSPLYLPPPLYLPLPLSSSPYMSLSPFASLSLCLSLPLRLSLSFRLSFSLCPSLPPPLTSASLPLSPSASLSLSHPSPISQLSLIFLSL